MGHCPGLRGLFVAILSSVTSLPEMQTYRLLMKAYSIRTCQLQSLVSMRATDKRNRT